MKVQKWCFEGQLGIRLATEVQPYLVQADQVEMILLEACQEPNVLANAKYTMDRGNGHWVGHFPDNTP